MTLVDQSKAELKTWLKIGARRLIPTGVTDIARDFMRGRKRTAAKSRPSAECERAPLSPADFVRALREVGLERGRDVFVHSALSQLGAFEGGAKSLIAALREVVGEATILMPTYPLNTSMREWMASPEVFDVRCTPSRMGALTEVFRSMEGVARSAHPSHAVAAQGAEARTYTQAHHETGSPCGPRSPFALLKEREGIVLCLGSSIGKVTQYHVLEDEAEEFPLDVYLDRPMGKTVVFADGSMRNVETRVHAPHLAPWRIDNFAPKEQEFVGHLRANGVIRNSTAGRARIAALDAARLNAMLFSLLEKGITIYHKPHLRLPGVGRA